MWPYLYKKNTMKKELLIAGLLFGTLISGNAQTTSFETAEGFTTGLIANQNNWTLAGTEMIAANATIVNNLASAGVNSLHITGTNSQPDDAIGVYSPIYSVAGSQVEVTQDIYIDALGGSDVYIEAYDLNGTSLGPTSSVIFDYTGTIYISRGVVSEALDYSEYGTYNANTWYTLKINYDFTANTIVYKLNDEVLYTGTVYYGQQVDVLGFKYDNYESGFYVDNVRIGAPLATNDNVAAAQFSVFPNPVSNVLNVSSEKSAITGITVTDLNGRIVKQANVSNLAKADVNVSELSAGVYLVNIKSDKGSVTKKIVKN